MEQENPPRGRHARLATSNEEHTPAGDTTAPERLHDTEPPLVDVRLDSEPFGALTVHVPPDTTAPALQRTLDTCRREVAQHGARLAAFLSLPGTDATGGDLAARCDTCFIREFANIYEAMNQIVSEQIQITDWQRQLDQFAKEHAMTGLVRLDEDAIREQSQMNGEIVDMRGRMYVFHE